MTSQLSLLERFLAERQIDIDLAAKEIGDDAERLRRVLAGDEKLGLTAALAIEAIRRNLPEIMPGD